MALPEEPESVRPVSSFIRRHSVSLALEREERALEATERKIVLVQCAAKALCDRKASEGAALQAQRLELEARCVQSQARNTVIVATMKVTCLGNVRE